MRIFEGDQPPVSVVYDWLTASGTQPADLSKTDQEILAEIQACPEAMEWMRKGGLTDALEILIALQDVRDFQAMREADKDA